MTLPSTISENFKLAARRTLDAERTEIEKYLKQFENEIVTPETKTAAKKTIAEIRAKQKEFKSMITNTKKAWNSPFDEIKGEADEVAKLFDDPIALIDRQIKECEAREREVREEKCRKAFKEILDGSIASEFLNYELYSDSRWLNVSTTMASVKRDITALKEKVEQEISLLEEDAGKFYDKAIETYKLNGCSYTSARAKISELKSAEEYLKKIAEESSKATVETTELTVETTEPTVEVTKPIVGVTKENPSEPFTNNPFKAEPTNPLSSGRTVNNPFKRTEEDFVSILVRKSDLQRVKELLEATGFMYKLV